MRPEFGLENVKNSTLTGNLIDTGKTGLYWETLAESSPPVIYLSPATVTIDGQNEEIMLPAEWTSKSE